MAADEEDELQCPSSFKDAPIRLSEEQLRLPTTEVYEAKHLVRQDDINHLDNFAGNYAHVRLLRNVICECPRLRPRTAADALGLFLPQGSQQIPSTTARQHHRACQEAADRRVQSLS